MKTVCFTLTIGLALILSVQDADCQIRNLIRNTQKEASKNINKNINEGLNNLIKGDEKNESANENEQTAVKQDESQAAVSQDKGEAAASATKEAPALVWAKYDFVPGDKIIFEDNLEGEENGEFPSRWDLVNGTVENAVLGGDNVIMFRGGEPMIVPYLKNPKIDYLPDVFTIDFDLYMNNQNTFTVYFYDRKNQRVSSGYRQLTIWHDGMELSPARSNLPNKESIENQWAHIAIAYTSGKMKAYINETRLINIPHLEFDPMGITLYTYHGSDQNKFYVKNIRIAEGGVKYYDRFLQNGKIVSNGIRFDVGKATLRPESMGVLNEINLMLTEHPDVKVSIEGHTDSDGDEGLNQKLSEERALAVKKQLESMGISSDRLASKGFGESKPVGPNDTPEGKAANRRVEFVKM